jgi:hypothetical protein
MDIFASVDSKGVAADRRGDKTRCQVRRYEGWKVEKRAVDGPDLIGIFD